jgi:hypothetical protein
MQWKMAFNIGDGWLLQFDSAEHRCRDRFALIPQFSFCWPFSQSFTASYRVFRLDVLLYLMIVSTLEIVGAQLLHRWENEF